MTPPSRGARAGIARIQALGYRSLRYVDQGLAPFQILVGPNASGKSTFLDVVGFLGDLSRTDLDTAVRGDIRLGIPHRAPDPRQLTWLREGRPFELAVELEIPERLRASHDGRYQRIRYELTVDVGASPRIEPEIEAWVWSSSPHVARVLGWAGAQPPLRAWLASAGLWPDGAPKPPDPKAAMERALRQRRIPRSSALYRELARSVSLKGCQDAALGRLRRILDAWFPESEGERR